MVPSGLGLAWLLGVRGVELGFWALVAGAVLVAAGPGVTALRGRFVIPRLGYARHTQTTDLATLIAVVIVLVGLGLVWLEQQGSIAWGRPVAALALTAGFLLLARESSLGRHYLVALLVAAAGVILLAARQPPLIFLDILVLAAAALLALGGAVALRSLVIHHPEAGDGAE